MKEWSKKADLANEMLLDDLYKVAKTKESYKSQGIGAEETKVKQQKQGGKIMKNKIKDFLFKKRIKILRNKKGFSLA